MSAPAGVSEEGRAATLDEGAARVRPARRYLVTGHARPDGDALGSMLATARALRALGKEVVVYDRDPAPPRLAFLPGAETLTTQPPTTPFDGTFVHDCGDAHLL